MTTGAEYLRTSADILWRYREAFAGGLRETLELASIAWGAGIVLGSMLGYLSSRSRIVGGFSRVIAFLLSGVPVIALLFWLHYPLQSMLGISVDPFITAAGTFAVINIFSVGEIVRAGRDEFPTQYLQAARVCGLGVVDTAFRIELPLIVRQVLPGILSLQVGVLHMTLFASLISVNEILRAAQHVNAECYRPVEIYTALGLFFLIASLPLSGGAALLRSRFAKDLSEH